MNTLPSPPALGKPTLSSKIPHPDFPRCYRAIVEESERWNLPVAYKADLTTHDYCQLAADWETSWPREFCWILREHGTHLMPPWLPIEGGEPRRYEWTWGTLGYYSRTPGYTDEHLRVYWWDGRELEHITLQEAKDRTINAAAHANMEWKGGAA